MATSAFEHVFPWTEEEYLALGETNDRVELFDGSLFVSPVPTYRHQRISRRLANALESAAVEAGLEVWEACNIRLRKGRIAIPDVVVTRGIDPDSLVAEARDIELICEITSTNAATDRVLKMHYYAAAGIQWYLLVDPQPLILTLYRLDEDKYVQEAKAVTGESLLFTTPFVTELDPASLG